MKQGASGTQERPHNFFLVMIRGYYYQYGRKHNFVFATMTEAIEFKQHMRRKHGMSAFTGVNFFTIVDQYQDETPL